MKYISVFYNYTAKYFGHYAGLPEKCWEGILLNLVESTLASTLYFLSIYFVTVLKINISTAGLLVSLYGFGGILGGILGGGLSDKFTPREVAIYSLIVESSMFLSLVFLQKIIFLAMIVFTLGISIYSFLTANQVWLLNQCKNESEKLKAINIISALSNLGLGLSAIIISIFSHYGFQYIFFTNAIILYTASFYLFYQRKTVPQNIEYLGISHKNAVNPPEKIIKKNKQVLILVLSCLFLMGCVVAQMSTTYSLYLGESFSQFGIRVFGMIFAINTLLVTLFQTPLGNFLSARNKILVIGIGGCLLGLGMFLVNFSLTLGWLIFCCIIYTMGEMIFFPFAQLICYQQAGQRKKGYSLGLFRTTYAASRVAGPGIGATIYYYMGSKTVWNISGALGVICLLACILYNSED